MLNFFDRNLLAEDRFLHSSADDTEKDYCLVLDEMSGIRWIFYMELIENSNLLCDNKINYKELQ